MKRTTIQVRVFSEIKKELEALATEKGWRVSELVRVIVAEYLEKNRGK